MDTQETDDPRSVTDFCKYGKRDRSLVICSMDYEKTGAWSSWATAEKDGFIVTPFFCDNKCLLHRQK